MSDRSRWQSEESFEVPQTPLIDIIFILIIFFLVATTFYSEERDVEVKLPEGSEGTIITRDNSRMVINVRQGGILVVNNAILSLEQLDHELQNYRAADSSYVEIRGDSSANHGRIMTVINMCKKHGLSDLSLTQSIVEKRE
ncbi:MAG: biopolymer transporter ExbD [Verrucomicrobia bacterium]|nr:biopolymer transporter ExbD [Verrucomicrobiota bacterium]MDA1086160.1 biopolymer transporter ExbD [Verrucomicrobiota bacterium]